MTLHRLSVLGYFIGIVVLASAIIRYFFIFYDPSQAIEIGALGLFIIVFSYIYNYMRNNDEDIKRIERRLDAVVNWEFRQPKEVIEEQMKGKDLNTYDK